MELNIVIGLFCTVLGAALGVATYKHRVKADAKEAGKNDGIILTELGHIKSTMERVERKQGEQELRHIEVLTRLVSVEASAKQAHKRIDEIAGDR